MTDYNYGSSAYVVWANTFTNHYTYIWKRAESVESCTPEFPGWDD